MTDSRQSVPELFATLESHDDGRVTLRAPAPGLWRDAPGEGALLRAGDELGWLEILGVLHRLRVPDGAVGVVRAPEDHGGPARRPVDYGAALLDLDPEALAGAVASEAAAAGAAVGAEGTLRFVAPSSGRFYHRPGPDRPAFVELGQVIERGQTIGLLEVMKTFTRINYDDPKLPARATILAIVAEDQQDIERGDVILELES